MSVVFFCILEMLKNCKYFMSDFGEKFFLGESGGICLRQKVGLINLFGFLVMIYLGCDEYWVVEKLLCY